MGKKIIITAGPTNERIDSVMKITNMSTGALGCRVAEQLLEEKDVDKVYFISPKLAYKPDASGREDKVVFIAIESAEDLLETLRGLLRKEHIDAVVHSAAVGDYKAKYSIRGEDLAEDIARSVRQAYDENDGKWNYNEVKKAVIRALDNPTVVSDDSGKMSSYEPRLMTMLTLTPKVIGSIKKESPDTMLIGFKLLDGVSKQHLFDVASRLREKNNADYIVANDLSEIRDGKHPAMVIGSTGIVSYCNDKKEIAETIVNLIKKGE